MKALDSSNYNVPVSIFEATDRVIKCRQDSETTDKEIRASGVCPKDSDSVEGKERKANFLYRFLF